MRYGEHKSVLRDAPRRRVLVRVETIRTVSRVSVAPIGPHVVVLTDRGAYVRS